MNNEARKDDKEQRYFVVCKLCDRKFRAITAHHLWAAHYGKNIRHPILYYKKTFQVAHARSYRTQVLIRRSFFKTLQRTGRRRTKAWVIEEIRRMAQQGNAINVAAVGATNATLFEAAKRRFGGWDAALQVAGFDPNDIRKLRKWTGAKVIDAIRDRKRQGKPINSRAVQRSNAGLYHAARYWWGGWDDALRAAGLDPERIRKMRTWSKTKVLDAIRCRRRQGKPLNAKALRRSGHTLYDAACRKFGRWDAALRAAGLDPERIRKMRVWSKTKVLDAIRCRRRQGKPLNADALGRSDHALYQAAFRRFGTWDDALRAAGFDPSLIRQRRRWYRREHILDALRDRLRQGKPINSRAVQRSDSGLFRSVCYRWDGWDDALRAAGLDPERIRKMRSWSKTKILDAIRLRRRQGKPLNAIIVQRSGYALYDAAFRRFGTWDDALRAAGLDPERIRKRHAWDKTKILDAIRFRRRQGKPLNASALIRSDNSLFQAACRRFGQWDTALRAASLAPELIRRQLQWSPRLVVQALRRRWKQGEDMSETSLNRANSPLLAAARSHFTTFGAALRAAGLDPERFRRHKVWDKNKIIASIRRRAERGPNHVRFSTVKVSDSPLFHAARLWFGGWFPALKAAGLDPDRYRIRTRWTDGKVLKALRDVYRRFGKATTSAISAARRTSIVRYILDRGWTLPQARAMAGLPDAQQKG